MLKKHWLPETDLNTGLIRAAEWIQGRRIDDRRAWPVSAGGTEASLWGGTVDAVCAVAALREYSPRIAAALNDVDLHATAQWIKGRQNKDGSFNSGEFGFAGTEPTAWALIALHKAHAKPDTKAVATGLAYLESRVDPRDASVSSTPGDGGPSRTMPSALTLWAFALWGHRKDLQHKIVHHLFRSQDSTSHGWGVNADARPNPATTAQVLVAFQAADVPPERFEQAVAYLLDQQLADGGWPDSIDEWHTQQDRSSVQLTHKCANSGTAWGLLALAPLGDHKSRTACLRAVRLLLSRQAPAKTNGSWTFWPDESKRHVWLTCQIVAALVAWHSGLPKQGIRREGMRLTNALLRVMDGVVNRAPLISTLGVLVAVVALSIDTAGEGFQEQFIGDSFWPNLLTSGLTTAAIGAITWVYRGLRDWRSRRRRR